MSKKILILGGSGLLGKSILKALLSNKENLLFSGDIKPNHIAGVKFLQTNILNSGELNLAINGMDIVINCTGQITNPINACFEQNSKGIKNIIEALGKKWQGHFIQISTIGVYGTILGEANEETLLNPESPYSSAKSFAEFLIKEYIHSNRYSILRLSNLYGDEQKKGIINYLVDSFNSNKNLHFNNNGQLARYFIHVDDAATNIARFIDHGPFSGVYNIVGKEKYTIVQLVELCETISRKSFSIEYNNTHPLENINVISDCKVRTVIDIKYNNTLSDYFKEKIKQSKHNDKKL